MAVLLPSSPFWQHALGTLGATVEGLDELAQAIRIIVTTQKGSVPHRPEFGCDLLSYLDAPQGIARARMIREVWDAITTWEPRVTLSSVTLNTVSPGASTLTVAWFPSGSTDSVPEQSTTVPVQADRADGDFITWGSIGIPGGVAPLGTNGTIPANFLPAAAIGGTAGDAPTAVDGGEIL